MLYVRANGLPRARLGIVVGKKFAPRAAERNLVKRMVRELFRQRQDQLAGRDVLLRLQARFPRAEFRSRTAVRHTCRSELVALMEVATRPLTPVPAQTAAPTSSSSPPGPQPTQLPQAPSAPPAGT
ncbi:ribonuclease P protein component [Cupriavidus gilardii J11]|uniref:Ribonuclease P protein component n=1 Tax=Cupriavidus gilardii J11 TaxID=936133 RepID=A0A562BJF5_9BURK|nr:ribonuclease P protein component [Cupriavidus gilardii J11]